MISAPAKEYKDNVNKEDTLISIPGVNSGSDDYVPDQIIVKFKEGVKDKKISELNLKYGTSEVYTSSGGGFKLLKIPEGKTVSEMVEAYRSDPDVEYAEPNYIAHALMVPNDPLYRYQWNLYNPEYGGIHMQEAWDISTGSNVTVAVLDTGVAYEDYCEGTRRRYQEDERRKPWWRKPSWRKPPWEGPRSREKYENYWEGTISRYRWEGPRSREKCYYKAPDLANTCFTAGYDFVNKDAHPNDDNSHGTHVAGTIAQSTNNKIGVAGVAFKACIMPVKVLDKRGVGTYSQIADGIYFAANNGARVISMSFGGHYPSPILERAIRYAYDKNITLVAAAGNDGINGRPSYPAAYDAYVIAVGATRYDETRAHYSTAGSYVDIAAPGGDMRVDQNSDGYGDGILQNTFNPNTKNTADFGYWFFQGTSMATAHVSGVAALILQKNPEWTPADVRAALQNTAEDKGPAGWDREYGWGIVNAYAAVNYTK